MSKNRVRREDLDLRGREKQQKREKCIMRFMHFTKYYQGDQIKENEMVKICKKYGG